MLPARKKAPVRNFHLPLPDDLHREIRAEAQRTGRPATALVRDAVEEWLAQRRKAALREELSAYAERWAGSAVDLDDVLEAASVEHLRGKRRARR
jgi:hypothetical protein